MYIPRTAELAVRQHIEKTTQHKDVLIVSGARQVGKTTLIENVLAGQKNLLRMNLQEEVDFARQIDATENFSQFEELLRLQRNFQPEHSTLFIDEAQESRQLGNYVRFMKEKWTDCTSVLSGSMMSEFFSHRYPVGRVKEIVLRPLTFEEFLVARHKDELVQLMRSFKIGDTLSSIAHNAYLKELERYFLVGGLPEVVLNHIQEQDWMERRKIVLNGFRRDFALKYGSEKAELVWKSFKAVAYHLGSPSKYTHVVKSSEHGYKTIPEIFSQLAHWHLVLSSEQKGSQPEKNLHVKRYLFDLGVAQQFRYDSRPLPFLDSMSNPETRRAVGGLLENYVAMELSSLYGELFGYRERNYEVDFVLKNVGQTIPVEVKASLKSKKNQFSSVSTYSLTYQANHGFCLNLAPPTPPFRQGKIGLISLPLYFVGQINRLLDAFDPTPYFGPK